MLKSRCFSAVRSLASRFTNCTRANVAVIFGIALVPVVAGAGVGVDYARALLVRTRLAEALDASALAVGGAAHNLSQTQMQTLAQNYFNANYNVANNFGTPGPVTLVTGKNTVTVSGDVSVPTVLMQLVGINTMKVSYSSQVSWGSPELWLSLVLDNTGSMNEVDGTGMSKIGALKTAVSQLLEQLNATAQNPRDVMVSIVPFTTGTNVGTSNKSASWLTFAPWDAVGSGDGAYENSQGHKCQSGTSGCSWVAFDPNHTGWTGCVMDRNQDYDVSNAEPRNANTEFPAAPPILYGHSPANSWNLTCPEQLVPLTDVLPTSGYQELENEVSGMTAGGTTDQPLGLEMGWMTLTDSAPFNPGKMPSTTTPIVIIVSDGLNTQDRWTGDGGSEDIGTDAREALVCSNMKSAGITIYAVYVDLNGTQGNSAPLQNCASTPGDYFDLTTSGEIITTLNEITQQIIRLHVSK